ncbi:LexA repressor [Vibrio alginolyticus 12G01]|nr:LexA repressor [Vibrio alginolyticus 12G01]
MNEDWREAMLQHWNLIKPTLPSFPTRTESIEWRESFHPLCPW